MFSIATIEFNRNGKLYIIDVDKDGLIDLNVYPINKENSLFTELGINQDRLNYILRELI